MVVGEVSERTDVAIVGAGPGGYTAAIRCAQAGKSVVLVERTRVGGTCLNVGCIPSKVLIHAADLASLPDRTANTGIDVSTSVDAAAMKMHRREVVGGLTSGVSHLLRTAGVEVWKGTARFARRNRLVIESDGEAPRHLEFTDAIVATGSRPIELPGLDWTNPLVTDSAGALGLDHIPTRLAVVGAGYIGVELGTAYAKLGSVVTLIEATDRVLPQMDVRLGRLVARRLRQLDVDLRLSTLALEAGDGQLTIQSGDTAEHIRTDLVVVAVGRQPNTEDLGLDVVGARLDPAGLVQVDGSRKAAPHIYAIGDITSGPALAHKATAEASVAAAAIAGQVVEFDPAAIPEVVFCDPELASVGHTLTSAEEAGMKTSTFRFPFAAGSRAATIDDNSGFVQLIADDAGTLIGAQLAGFGVSELVGEIAHGIEMAATAAELADTIHPHPSMSEAVMEAALGLDGRPLHVTRG
ncbi:MAG: dihydrolipoyl dehydrogenase [Actinomycetia bacterium]|nr:dihydrolipoyl dehydrogenase [Actinomycetes bacterium]MCP4959387.1 dihydrolipoyl dehydrogenase [Actinomycetes bacterium]